jgi:O-antigen/teichoic acid export membrane protein
MMSDTRTDSRSTNPASRKRVVINSLSGMVRLFAEIVVAFILSPIIVHQLGNDRYGVWELLLAIVGYLGFLELGVSPAVVQGVARASGSGDPAAMRRTFATGTWLLASLGLFGGLLILFAAPFGPQITNFQPSVSEPFIMLFALFGANMAVALPNNGFSAFLLGMQEHSFVNMVRVVIIVVRATLVYVVLKYQAEHALIYMAMLVLGTEIVESFVFVGRIYFIHRGMSLHPRYFEWTAAKDLMVYGAKSAALMASGNLVRRVSMIVVAHQRGPTAVTYYAIVARLSDYAHSFVLTLGTPLTSYFSHMSGGADRATLVRTWQQTTRMLMLFSLSAPIGLAWLGPPFIARWMGPEYAAAGYWVLIILCTGFFLESVASNCNRLLLATAKHGGVAAVSVVSAPVCLALSILFGAQWGIAGVAGAVSLYVVGQAWVELYQACGVLNIPITEHLRKTVMPYIAPLLLLVLALTAMNYVFTPTTYARIALTGLVSMMIFIAAALAVAWRHEERAALRAWLMQFARSTSPALRKP